MEISEPVSEHHAVDRKLSHARARLFARLDELGRRVNKAKNSLDVARIVRNHPLTAVGLAFSAGILAGLPRGQGRIGSQIAALMMGMAATAARSAATGWLLTRVRASSADA